MADVSKEHLLQLETNCVPILCELKVIWDEIGESVTERRIILQELEEECLNLYRRKVEQARQYRAQLHKAVADSEAEIGAIYTALGEAPLHVEKNPGSLREELYAITPQLEEIRRRKAERKNQFHDHIEQIQKILKEIRPSDSPKLSIDDFDLSIRKLDEFGGQLQQLQKEKADRIKTVTDLLSSLNSLSVVLGIDFNNLVQEGEFGFYVAEGSQSISDEAIERLASEIQRLRDIKRERMEKLQDLVTTMLELWNLMDTPIEEQQSFQKVACNVAASEHEIVEPNALSVDFIEHVEEEVMRLEKLKTSKMKDLVLKKKSELEELRKRAHVLEDDNHLDCMFEAVEQDGVDTSLFLEQIELQISAAKDEAFSRKEILERVEKWLAACEEESWLEEYNRDENRYSAGKGSHLTLKRAEKARALVTKIPAMVEALVAKTTAWEDEMGVGFKYDGALLLAMMEEYNNLRLEKEQERKRQREQRRLQGQLTAEQETLFGSKPSSLKNVKSMNRNFSGTHSRKPSLGGSSSFSSKSPRSARKGDEASTLSTEENEFCL